MAVDPRQNGLAPLRGLNRAPQPTPEELEYARLQQEFKTTKKGVNTNYRPEVDTFTESKHYEPGTPGYEKGLSRYDREEDVLTTPTSFEELNQSRYENQSAWDVAANGIAKAAGRAATSFISGVVGSVAGIGTALVEGRVSGLWDNPLSNALADLDDWCNENFVNYQSISQKMNNENGEWWKNLDSLNMWMDDVVTNTGFMIGMAGAAAVTGGAAGAVALAARKAAPKLALRATMGSVSAGVNAARIAEKYGPQVAKAITLFNSSAGEAALEGLTTKREMVDEETQRINATIDQHIAEDPNVQMLDQQYQAQMSALDQMFGYNRNNPQYQQYKQQLDQQYNQQRAAATAQWEQRRAAAMQELNDSADKAGNATALLNLAILIPSNFNMYGRLIDKSFRNAEKSAGRSWAHRNSMFHEKNAIGQRNVTGDIAGKSYDEIMKGAAAGETYGSRSFIGNYGKRIGSTMLSEGVYEEMGQGAASAGAKAYHGWENADNYWRARLDPDSIDRTADGSHDFLSAVGKGLKETYGSAEGWREGFIGGITGMAFATSEMRDELRDTRFAKQSAKELNAQLADKRLPNLLQHLVAQGYYDNNKQRFADEGNQNDWKTEDDKAVFALISSFARAGRMDDLYHILDSYTGQMSDDDVADLINNSTREVGVEDQKALVRKDLRDEINKRIQSQLREGASVQDFFDRRSEAQQARQNEEQVKQEASAVLGDIATDKRKHDDLRRIARRSKDEEKREAARRILEAEEQTAKAVEEYEHTLSGSTDTTEGILDEYNRRSKAIDGMSPESYYEGPFVDKQGNRLKADQVKAQIAHNTEKTRKAVERYLKIVEGINQSTRGSLSKEQEDYLAYTQFLSQAHIDRANGLMKKWRGILPDVIRIRVPKGNAEVLERRYGLPKGTITETEDGFATVNTKDLTDDQFATFTLHALQGQEYLTWNNASEDAVAQARRRLSDEALDQAMRSGTPFDKAEFIRDMEDVQKCYDKSDMFAKAFEEAMSNPEGILNAKERAMRFLRNKWNKTRNNIRYRTMSADQLAALDEQELIDMDDYHFSRARGEILRKKAGNAIKREIAGYFMHIKDKELRDAVIERVKNRLQELIAEVQDSATPTRIDENSLETDEDGNISMMIDMSDGTKRKVSFSINPSDIFSDIEWSTLSDELKKQIESGLKALNKAIPIIIKGYNKTLATVSNFYNRMRNKAKEAIDSNDSVQSLCDKASAFFGKARTTVAENKTLGDLLSVMEEKLSKMKDSNSPAARMLRDTIRKIRAKISSSLKENEQDVKYDDNTPDTPAPVVTSDEAESPQSPDEVDDFDTPETQYLQSPDATTEDIAMTAQMRDLGDSGSRFGNQWQTVTGEVARWSNGTYLPYHTIINNELAKYPDAKDTKRIKVPDLGRFGGPRTIAEWRRYAARSEEAYERMKDDFGYVDAGNVKAGDEIKFRITRTKDGELMVFMVHTDKDGVEHIIGDLTHYNYGVTDSTEKARLKAMYDVFEKELGDKQEVESEHISHAANIYAGFPKFSTAVDGEVPTRTVASFGDEAKDVEFAVVGSGRMFNDMLGSGKTGQPLVVLKRPGNNGNTRRIGIKASTKPFTPDGVEAKVISAALKNLSPEKAVEFLKHFLNCRTVYTEGAQQVGVGLFTDEETVATQTTFTVVARTNETGGRKRIKITVNNATGAVTFNGDMGHLRANVSPRLMEGSLYAEAVKGAEDVPSSYNELLKQICHVKLDDLRMHDSWVTINPLNVVDGKVIEEELPLESQRIEFNNRGNYEYTSKDSETGATYSVEVSEADENMPSVVSIKTTSGSKFTPITITELNKNRVLKAIAQALSQRSGTDYNGRNRFSYNGIVYVFEMNPNGTVKDVKFSEKDTALNKKGALDAKLAQELAFAARHYDGRRKRRTLNRIIDKWFKRSMIPEGSELYKALEQVLKDIKAGKTTFGIGPVASAQLLNALNDRQRREKEKRVTDALVKHLVSHGIKIYQDREKGQQLVAKAHQMLRDFGEDAVKEYGRRNGVRFFLSSDGTIVYGFALANKKSIYLDPDIMKPEALIHEYTHLWSYVLRNGTDEQKAKWNSLVKELSTNKKYASLWQDIQDTYGKNVQKDDGSWDDDAIADEVFAKLTGEHGEEWVMRNVDDNATNASKILKELKNIVDDFINFIKTRVFHVPNYVERMEDLVMRDMLSDNPLTNFGNLETEQSDETENEAEVESEPEKASDTVTVTIDSISGGMRHDKAVKRLNNVDGVVVDGDNVTIPNNEDTKEELRDEGFVINFALDIDRSEAELELTIADSVLAENLGREFLLDDDDGLSGRIADFADGVRAGYMNAEQFIDAVKLLLTEQQRNDMWNAAKSVLGKGSNSNHRFAARIQGLFHDYLQGNKTGNKTLDNLFKTLKSSIRKYEGREQDLSVDEMAIQATSHVFSSPTDPFYELDNIEGMQHELLDMLTPRDVEYLEMAGYDKSLYFSLSDESKERLRKCVM